MRVVLLCLCACSGGTHYVRPPEEVLRDAKALSLQDACAMLTGALASGDYSAQRRTADVMSAANTEYQLGHAREQACRQVEQTQAKTRELEEETDLVVLRSMARSAGEDDAIRKRAARRLLQVLPKADYAAVKRVAASEPRGDTPGWYVEMRIEEKIEQRLMERLGPDSNR